VSGYIAFRSLEDLRAFFLRCGPEDVDDFDHCVRAWGKGSVWINVSPEQYAKLKQLENRRKGKSIRHATVR
jgi:hypothetical protein